jgi:guanylate kinase
MKTRMIIVAAPSGAGKSSFVDKVCQEEPRLYDIITYTTRAMRRGELQGKPYHFISKDEFEGKVKENFFVEWARVHTNMYGTPLDQIEQAWAKGQCVIMDVDVQGADTFKEKFPDSRSIFILPPSIDELRRRVIKRDGKVPDDLEIRMQNAIREIEKADQFDFRLVNDDFESSYKAFKKIVEELLR